MGQPRPDIIVGIDVGQTCSGVAYSIGPDWCEPRIIRKWPGPDGTENADKVATRVGYDISSRQLISWGFECVLGDTSKLIRHDFKLALDADWLDERGFTSDQARMWYFDFLKCLHQEIAQFFDRSVPNWQKKQIEYNFSIPTTWNNPAMIASIEDLIKQAGFHDNAHQSVRMSLTEAEAAAIEACTQYRAGDIFMIVDAGGGTTDVNILRARAVGRTVELEPLDHVEGEPIGSTLIDFHMGQHILDRLEPIRNRLTRDAEAEVEDMLRGRFQTLKHSFPDPLVPEQWLDIRSLPGAQTFEDLGIRDSRMAIRRTTLQEHFDTQVNEMFQLIDERLQEMLDAYPNQSVSYIILSGGFGSSPYLYNELRRRYMMNAGFQLPNISSLRIMTVEEPQLAVIKGLVKERTQRLGNTPETAQEVFKTRRCRNSYGVAVRAPYEEDQHQGLQYVTDANGNRWVERLVEKGDEIDLSKGIVRKYSATVMHGDQSLPRQARIVMSAKGADELPRKEGEGDCHQVAIVQYALTKNDMKLKNRHFWQFKKKFWKADFSFVVNLGPADLKFQVLGTHGILSSNADTLSVEYMDPHDRDRGIERQDSKAPISAPMLEMTHVYR